MKAAASIAAVTLLAACAVPQQVWVKQGGDLATDTAVCDFEGEKAAVSSDRNAVVAAYEKADRRRTVTDLCMRSKGWQLQRPAR